MNRRILILAAVGLSGVAAAFAARQLLATGPEPSDATVAAGAPAAVAPAAAPPAKEEASAPAPSASDPPVVAQAAGEGDFLVLPEDGDASRGGEVRLGGWLRSANLPMCGRTAEAALFAEPGGGAATGKLPSCEAAYGEFPSVQLLAVGPLRGEWIRVGAGWARVEEVRSAETLVVGGREFWHDLFNVRAESVGGREVSLRGDTDPCAREVCGSAHGLWEQEQEIRTRFEAEHPGGIPPAVEQRMKREIQEMFAEADRTLREERKAAEERAREVRTLRLPVAPSDGKPTLELEKGDYLCCT